MHSGDDRAGEVGHLAAFIRPCGVLRLDGDDTALHIVYVILVLFQGHRDNCDIHFLVDTLCLQTVLQDVSCGVGYVVGNLYRLRDGLDRLYLCHFLRSVNMAHDESEDPEEQEEQSQTEEHDTHGQQSDTDAMWIVALQLGILGLVGLDEVLNAGCGILCRLYTPGIAMTGIALVCSKGRNGDGVNQFNGITIVEADPYGF